MLDINIRKKDRLLWCWLVNDRWISYRANGNAAEDTDCRMDSASSHWNKPAMPRFGRVTPTRPPRWVYELEGESSRDVGTSKFSFSTVSQRWHGVQQGLRVTVWIFFDEKKLTVAKQRWTPRTGSERQVEKDIGPSQELLKAILDMPEWTRAPAKPKR